MTFSTMDLIFKPDSYGKFMVQLVELQSQILMPLLQHLHTRVLTNSSSLLCYIIIVCSTSIEKMDGPWVVYNRLVEIFEDPLRENIGIELTLGQIL